MFLFDDGLGIFVLLLSSCLASTIGVLRSAVFVVIFVLLILVVLKFKEG